MTQQELEMVILFLTLWISFTGAAVLAVSKQAARLIKETT